MFSSKAIRAAKLALNWERFGLRDIFTLAAFGSSLPVMFPHLDVSWIISRHFQKPNVSFARFLSWNPELTASSAIYNEDCDVILYVNYSDNISRSSELCSVGRHKQYLLLIRVWKLFLAQSECVPIKVSMTSLLAKFYIYVIQRWGMVFLVWRSDRIAGITQWERWEREPMPGMPGVTKRFRSRCWN